MASLVAIKDVKLDTEGFRKVMRDFAVVFGKLGGAVVKDQAARLADDLLDYTLPVTGNGGPGAGRSAAARKVGEQSMQADLNRIFKPLHTASYEDIADQGSFPVFAAWVADRRKHNKKAGIKASEVNGDNWVGFQSMHGGKGRKNANFNLVNKGEEAIRRAHVLARGGDNVKNYKWNVKAANTTYFIDDYESKIPAYIKEAKKRVGRLKSGWYEAAVALGRKPKAAEFITGNTQGNGYAVDESQNATKPTVVIANRIHFLMGGGAGASLWKSAFHYRNYAMRVKIAEEINKVARGNPKRANELVAALELSSKQYSVE